jgi:hypothetical protein
MKYRFCPDCSAFFAKDDVKAWQRHREQHRPLIPFLPKGLPENDLRARDVR